MATNPDTSTPVPSDLFAAGDGSVIVALAGLLAHQPELVGTEKTPAAWQKALDAYLKTPRP